MNVRTCRSLVFLALTLLLPGAAGAQHFPSEQDLTELIRSRVEEDRAVGIVVGVLEADGSTHIVSYGDAGPGARPLGGKSLFEIGSISKVFTATLLADMVARGEISLSDPVSDHLPSKVTMPSRDGREITLLDLSTHHSALPRLPDNMSPADASNPYADYTVEQMYAFLSSHELRRDIGSQYEYSNLAVGLLGHVLARVGGGSYEDVMQERVLEPLGMSMTGITLEGEMRDWMAKGHDQQGNVVPLWDLPTLAGAGALRSDVGDMLTFLAANIGPPESQFERAMRNSHEVRESLSAQMDIGLNWHVRNVGDEKIVWHNGGTAGFRTFIGFDPDKGVGAVVLTNSGHGADDIGFHLINPGMPLAPAPEPRQERVEIEVAASVLETYVGEYELSAAFSIVVTLEAGALFLQATGQGKAPVFAESETKFFLRVADAQVSFTKDDSNRVTGLVLHQGGANQPATKVASEVPDVVERTEVEVAANVLETYVGEYELAPTFSIVVTLEAGALFLQATGQGKAPMFAESETKFFLRVVDAQVSFTKDDSSTVTGLVLHQNGANQPGQKVR